MYLKITKPEKTALEVIKYQQVEHIAKSAWYAKKNLDYTNIVFIKVIYLENLCLIVLSVRDDEGINNHEKHNTQPNITITQIQHFIS